MKNRKPLKPFKGAVLKDGRWTGKPPQRKRQKGIRRVSSRKHKRDLEYGILRKWFLSKPENSFCLIAKLGLIADYDGIVRPHHRAAVQVHHVKGRGKYYLDESTFMAVSAEAHIWMHQVDVEEARKRGWIQSRE